MSSSDAKIRAAQEMAYCSAILARSNTSILHKILPAQGLVTWKHYPEKDVYDPISGAQWYYHCHDNSKLDNEHGHFHCFVRPDGKDSDPCHLIAVGVDARSRLKRLFTVNQWVVGGKWYDAQTTNQYLDRFNAELAEPEFLVNRWLTAVLTYYEDEIISLNIERDEYIRSLKQPLVEIMADRNIEVLSELDITELD